MKKIIFILIFIPSLIVAQWVQTNGPIGGRVYALAVSGSKVFAGTDHGVFKSTNNTQSWCQTSLNNCRVNSIAIKDSNVLCGLEMGGVYISTNMGLSWSQTPMTMNSVMALAVCREYVFAGTFYNGLYYTTNCGNTWALSPLNFNVYSMAVYDSIIFAGTLGDGIYRSDDFGRTWSSIGLNNSSIWSIAVNYPYIYASNVYTYLSPDFGQTWIRTALLMESQKSIVAYGPNVFVAADLIQRSTNYGYTWSYVFNIHGTTALTLCGNSIVSGGSGGAYISSNNGNSWNQTPFNGRSVQSLFKTGSVLYAGLKTSGGVHTSNNNGGSWIQSSLNSGYVSAFLQSGSRLFAGNLNGAFFTTDEGQNWTQTSLHRDVRSLLLKGSEIFAGAYNGGVYFSTNSGESWTQTSLNDQCINSLAIKDSIIFAGAGFFGPSYLSYGIYKSADNGQTWTFMGFPYQVVSSLAVKGTKIFAGTNGNQIGAHDGVFISTNNGETWALSPLHRYVKSLAVSGQYIFCGTDTFGVYISSDDGASWVQKNEGMGNQTVNSLFVSSDYVYAGNEGSSVWKRQLSEIIGIKNINKAIPQHYSISQNYPNPFNPTTKIKFDIPPSKGAGGMITTISIYDALGREVNVLINQLLTPGTYEVQWDGTNYPSGVYFCKITASDYSATIKLILLK